MSTHMEAQGLTGTDLKSQAAEVLSTLSEDQLLVVLAYARALKAEQQPLQVPNLLEDLLEDLH